MKVQLPRLTWGVAHNIHSASVLGDLLRITIEWHKTGYRAKIEGANTVTLPTIYPTQKDAKIAAKAHLNSILNASLVFPE